MAVPSPKKRRIKVQPIRAKRWLWLTGTPILKRPIDLWPICQKFDPNGLGKSWKQFVYRYCDAHNDGFGLNTKGASNLDELNMLLRKAFMVRRMKSEVLKDLPPKVREIVLLPADGLTRQIERELSTVRRNLYSFEKMLGTVATEEDELESFEKIMETYWESYVSHDGTYNEVAATLLDLSSLAFEELSMARKELAIAKLPMVKEYVNRLVDADEKVILFCHHTDVAEKLHALFPGNSVLITGKVHPDKRQAIVDRFQDDPTIRVIIGNIDAAGVGFTMTAGCHVVFAELVWNPAQMEQAEDRAWRIGQLCTVWVHYLVVDGSLDARTISILLEKQEIIAAALDRRDGIDRTVHYDAAKFDAELQEAISVSESWL